jgi:hypothetical protein
MQSTFRCRQHFRFELSHRRGSGACFGHQRVGRYDLMHQADLRGFLGEYGTGGENEVERPRDANQPRQ